MCTSLAVGLNSCVIYCSIWLSNEGADVEFILTDLLPYLGLFLFLLLLCFQISILGFLHRRFGCSRCKEPPNVLGEK